MHYKLETIWLLHSSLLWYPDDVTVLWSPYCATQISKNFYLQSA